MSDRIDAPTAAEIFGDAPAIVPTTRQPLQGYLGAAGIHRLTATSTGEDVRDALEHLRDQVSTARLDDLDRLALEKLVLDTLAEQRIKNVRALVRTALGLGAKAKPTEAAPPALVRDDEPWDEPVDTAEILDCTAALVRRYIALPAESADGVALWVAGAWSIKAAPIFPMLLITAAAMRCGKSTLAELVAAVTPRSLMVASLTPAVLFRVIDEHSPTLIMDEADTWLTDEKSELRGIVNAGHSRTTAVVARCVGDDNTVRLFSVFAPRVLAMIGRPPSTVLDRSIVVELRRKRADERVDRLRCDRLETEASILRRRWRRWADDRAADLDRADPDTPAELHDRAADNWRHLLAVADLAGDEWVTRGRRAAAASVEATVDDTESIGVELLADVRRVFDDRDVDAISSTDVAAALAGMDGRPWAEWSQGRPLTTAKLARLLKPFKVFPVDVRLPAGVKKSYTLRSLIDAWSRYLPTKAQHRNNANVYGPESQKTKAQQTGACCAFETATNPIKTGANGDCCVVALPDAEIGARAQETGELFNGQALVDGDGFTF